jgi:hypothetical protein
LVSLISLITGAAALLGCAVTSADMDSVAYPPRPHLALTVIDPSKVVGEDTGYDVAKEPVVLVNHSRGVMLFDPQLGIGGEGIFREIPYYGFPRSFDVFADGSVVLVPINDGGRLTTGMFVTLPSGDRVFLAERGVVRQLRAAGMKVFGLRDHKFHEAIAHFPEFEH